MKGKNIQSKTIVTPSNSNIKEALMKKALGYEVCEIAEEYVAEGDELKLVKRKINKKTYPPDLDAIELALNEGGEKTGEYELYSDEELLEEKHNLLSLLKNLKKE